MSDPLPAPCSDLVANVVKSTRLWTRERDDVARELTAHFRDALDRGITPEQAARDFGDPARAAAAIRRAKIRNRPLVWHIARRSMQLCGVFFLVLLLTYGFLAARYYTASPTISHNYARELAAITTAPEPDRAYPTYRTFYINQHKADVVAHFPNLINVIPDVLPGEFAWPEAQTYCKQFATDLELVRKATALPAIAAPVTDGDDPVVFEEITRRLDPTFTLKAGSENPELTDVLMPYLGWCRSIGRSLEVDCRVALADGDTARATHDLLAIIDIGRQLNKEPFLIGRLVHVAVIAFADAEIRRILSDAPATFTEPQLRELSAALTAATNGSLRANLESERLFIDDWLQRAYTDDGHGDGRITRKGLDSLQRLLGDSRADPFATPSSSLSTIVSPVAPTLLMGRKEFRDAYERALAAAEKDAATPRWQRTTYSVTTEVESASHGPLNRIRSTPFTLLVPAFTKAIESCDSTRMDRDATLTAIALEIHHRRTGSYPAALNELVPALLPALPTDLWDGTPLKYKLKDGKPLLYTVGCDKADNGGIRTDDRSVLSSTAELLRPESKNKDWIYMPHIRIAPKVDPVPAPKVSGPESSPLPPPHS